MSSADKSKLLDKKSRISAFVDYDTLHNANAPRVTVLGNPDFEMNQKTLTS